MHRMIAPSVNILRISTVIYMVAFVNLILKKIMMMMMCSYDWTDRIEKTMVESSSNAIFFLPRDAL